MTTPFATGGFLCLRTGPALDLAETMVFLPTP